MKKTMIVLSAVLALMSCNKVAPETETSGTIDACFQLHHQERRCYQGREV